MLLQPTSDRSRLVYGVTIGNQVHLLFCLLAGADQATKEFQKYWRGEALAKNHKSQATAIGDGRDHVAAKPLTGTEHDRGLTTPSIGSPSLMIRTQPHLVQPMNLRPILSCPGSNRGIFFLQPSPHRHRILFIRSSHRLLRGQSPSPQVPPHRPHRNLQTEAPRQQLLHRLSSPQGEGQAQLVGTPTDDQPHRASCLLRSQARNWRSPATSRLQGPSSASFDQSHPASHRTARYPEHVSRLGLRKTFLNRLDDSPAKILLGLSRQRASILFLHARTITEYPLNVTYIML